MIPLHCFCGSDVPFQNCCEPYIKGFQKVPTAKALMQSRYSAYATQEVDYLMMTTHISQRKFHSKQEILLWAKNNSWLKLEILAETYNTVEFKAYYLNVSLQTIVHHEKSTFKLENGNWFYVDGIFYE
jgi:SEC-C motif-containing protein